MQYSVIFWLEILARPVPIHGKTWPPFVAAERFVKLFLGKQSAHYAFTWPHKDVLVVTG
ncbi:MAG: hypothetical protein IPK53_08510 [bacterium]|nr:hypothetical protein [bacterium]